DRDSRAGMDQNTSFRSSTGLGLLGLLGLARGARGAGVSGGAFGRAWGAATAAGVRSIAPWRRVAAALLATSGGALCTGAHALAAGGSGCEEGPGGTTDRVISGCDGAGTASAPCESAGESALAALRQAPRTPATARVSG